jgi:putative FmdB family regulatory protein
MPIYPYLCGSCGHHQDVLQKMSAAPLTTCPECNAETFSKQLSAPAFQLKGSGWYVTDFRENGKKPEGADKADGADKAGEKAADKGAESSTEKAGEGVAAAAPTTPAAPTAAGTAASTPKPAASAAPAAAPASSTPAPSTAK